MANRANLPAVYPFTVFASAKSVQCRCGFVAARALSAQSKLQPCPDCSLGVVLMGRRITKVDENAVTHVLRHEAAEALHYHGDAPKWQLRAWWPARYCRRMLVE